MLYTHLAELYSKLEQTTKRLEKNEILSEFLKKLSPKEKDTIYLLKGKIFADYDSRETGISEQLAIKALAKSSGAKEEDIVKKWKSLGDLGQVAEETITKKKQSTIFSHKISTEKVLENLRKLPELQGKGTVAKKLALVSELITSSSPLEAKYLMRTLLGDLRIGLGD